MTDQWNPTELCNTRYELCVCVWGGCWQRWMMPMQHCWTRACQSVRWLAASWVASCCWRWPSTATDAIHAGAHVTVTAHCQETLTFTTPPSTLRILMLKTVFSHTYTVYSVSTWWHIVSSCWLKSVNCYVKKLLHNSLHTGVYACL